MVCSTRLNPLLATYSPSNGSLERPHYTQPSWYLPKCVDELVSWSNTWRHAHAHYTGREPRRYLCCFLLYLGINKILENRLHLCPLVLFNSRAPGCFISPAPSNSPELVYSEGILEIEDTNVQYNLNEAPATGYSPPWTLYQLE